jgi:hypothetical protein
VLRFWMLSDGPSVISQKMSDNCAVSVASAEVPATLLVNGRLASPHRSPPLFGEAIGQRSLPQHLFTVACNEARCRYQNNGYRRIHGVFIIRR